MDATVKGGGQASLWSANGFSVAAPPQDPQASESTDTPGVAPPTQHEQRVTRREIWMGRTALIVRVIFYIYIGLLLTVLPWTDAWSHNSLLLPHTALHTFFTNNFVRGIVSGFGLLDMWIGVWEAVRYREPRRA